MTRGCQAGVEPANLTTVMTKDGTKTSKSYDTIKLGIDAHAKWYYVARQLDGATPQPVQKMTFEALLRFVAKQQELAGEVHTCYEAGAFGYALHRKLEMLGVTQSATRQKRKRFPPSAQPVRGKFDTLSFLARRRLG